jgi:hypothetical protein
MTHATQIPTKNGASAMRETVTETGGAIKGLKAWIAASVTLLVLLGVLGSGASSAFAAEPTCESCKPWWHLTSGTRPTYLRAGAGKPEIPGEDEIQEIILPLIEFSEQKEQGAIKLGVGGKELGLFVTEPLAAGLGLTPLTEASLQAALEGPYGKGLVHVSEESKGGVLSFHVQSPGGSEPIAVGAVLPGSEPTVKIVSPGKPGIRAVPDGELYMTAENLGDANASGAESKLALKDVLPKGLKATGVIATEPVPDALKPRQPIPCTLEEHEGAQIAACTTQGSLPPYSQLEMRISVDVEPGAESALQENEFSISGGGTPPSSVTRPVTISNASVPFGVEQYEMGLEEEGGEPVKQAGKHPFQLTTTIALNQLQDIHPLIHPPEFTPEVAPAALTKDLDFKLPPGLIGNATAIPQCSTNQFFEIVGETQNNCPADTAVGVAVVTVHEPWFAGTSTLVMPVFNLDPDVGEPARFGFYVVFANSPVLIDTSVRSGSDYGVDVHVENITQVAGFLSSEVTFWGVPGDSRHDSQRGWGCLYQARAIPSRQPCIPAAEAHPKPFLVLPTSCERGMGTSVQGDSWADPGDVLDFTGAFSPSAPLSGCNRLQFPPEIKAAPDSEEASKPTGLTVDVHVPQEVNNNAAGFASSNVRDIAVKLPAGVAVNPSSADGLEACTESLVGFMRLGEVPSDPGVSHQLFSPYLPGSIGALAAGQQQPFEPGTNFCANGSKLGTARIKLPILPNALEGAVYLAAQEANPFGSVLAMYLVVEDPVSGVLIKVAGEVSICQGAGEALGGLTCETQGQLITTFSNSPEGPFEDAELHFYGGERAPLASPTRCGTYTTEALFTPWSGSPPVRTTSSFNVTSGPNHSACVYPGQALPFSPTLTGGATNIQAGAFSPFTLTMSRLPGEQNLQSVEAHLPPGLSGILSNVELCPEPQANQGACGPNSLIGETTVSVGVGGSPFSVKGGKFFLTGPYNGTGGCTVDSPGCAPFGITFEVPAKAGPFDFAKTARNHPACDCVLVRGKIEIDPHTAAITIVSNPPGTPDSIPTHLEGVPLEIQKVNAITTRSNFQFNPTNCNKLAVTGTIHSSEGGTDTINVPLQVTNCGALKFAPKFSVSTSGKTSKANGASLTAKVTYPSAPQGTYANIAKVKVDLPKQLPSRLTTLQKACTNKQFELNPANCPKESKIGFAKVTTPLLPVPLEGPAIFVSHGGEAFPSLTMVLQGYGVTVDLVGTTFISKAGITSTTFKTVPDTPFSSFTLTLPQGKFSALAANGDLCTSKLTMPTEFLAQNGLKINESTKIGITGCAKKKTLTRAQKLTAALKACHKKAKGKRAGCEQQAHKKYGAVKQAKRKRGK